MRIFKTIIALGGISFVVLGLFAGMEGEYSEMRECLILVAIYYLIWISEK